MRHYVPHKHRASKEAMLRAMEKCRRLCPGLTIDDIARIAKEEVVSYSSLLERARSLLRGEKGKRQRSGITQEQVEEASAGVRWHGEKTMADFAREFACCPSALHNRVRAYREKAKAQAELLAQALPVPAPTGWEPSGFIRPLTREELSQGRARPARSRVSEERGEPNVDSHNEVCSPAQARWR